MLLLTGPPGSGKTSRVLQEVRGALAEGRSNFRLLLPTATMVDHVRHELAREGLLVRPKCILTLSGLVRQLLGDSYQQPGEAAFTMLVRQALEQLDVVEFRGVSQLPGFHAAVARLTDELALTGVDAGRLRSYFAGSGQEVPLAEAFLRVYGQVRQNLSARGWVLRGDRLQQAAAKYADGGLSGVQSFYVDGFFNFATPELKLLDAIRQRADLNVTLPLWEGAAEARLFLRRRGLREEALQPARKKARAAVVTAPTQEQECDEIARRILELTQTKAQGGGRPLRFREIGIVTRNGAAYFPVLQTAFERFGIPARIYTVGAASGHAVIRYLSDLVGAARKGWDFEETLNVLRLSPSGHGLCAAGDEFEIAVREAMPGAGLARLRTLTEDSALERRLTEFEELNGWLGLELPPDEWARRALKLREFVAGGPPRDSEPEVMVEIWRGNAAALQAYEEALQAAVTVFDSALPVSLDAFWEVAKAAFRDTSLRVYDGRRDVVHVMDVYEARQWELPVVFVCGLLEKQFPLYHSQDPIFPDSLRTALNEFGLRLRTVEDWDKEERFLFNLAASRAVSQLYLSYPRQNEAGDEALPSFLLQEFQDEERLPEARAEAVAPLPAHARVRVQPSGRVSDFGLLAAIRTVHDSVGPTAIERYLQCPFQFFADRTLRLAGLPGRPEARLDPLAMGTISHRAVADWTRRRTGIEEITDQVFEEYCAKENIPPGYRREAARLELLRNLHKFQQTGPDLGKGEVQVESAFKFSLDLEQGAVQISGRIDCYHIGPAGEAHGIEYKYTSSEGIKKRFRANNEGTLVQGGLYLSALEKAFHLRPGSLKFVGLRDDIEVQGWSLPEDIAALIRQASARTAESMNAVFQGDIRVHPTDPDQCRICNYADACRKETLGVIVQLDEAADAT